MRAVQSLAGGRRVRVIADAPAKPDGSTGKRLAAGPLCAVSPAQAPGKLVPEHGGVR